MPDKAYKKDYQIVCYLIRDTFISYDSGHWGLAVLLPGIAISW